MNHPNEQVNWLALGEQANWSASRLAKLCGISVRTLQRHFRATTGKTPKCWLNEHRQKQAVELLQDGSTIKETAARLGYKHTTHFSQQFKRYTGQCPAQINANLRPDAKCRVSIANVAFP